LKHKIRTIMSEQQTKRRLQAKEGRLEI